jgi:hypothetical protein
MAKMGSNQRLPEQLPPDDEHDFPNLRRIGYRITSDNDARYNCIAYAAGESHRWWQPGYSGYHWPETADKGDGIESLRNMFETLGYVVCDNEELEQGFDKVALYADNEGYWTHAAKQKDNGLWISKLGRGFDITHRTPHCFGGPNGYGNAVYFMKKPCEKSDVA